MTEEEKKAIVDGIRVQYDGINLTMATISEIIEATVKLITPEFAAMTWKDRNGKYKIYLKFSLKYKINFDRFLL